ncbi:uncharacterized protein LOC127250472 [Andrographis paniculata]|uniref:uncharacterized protein LOC127250472 n=1 Tax=Andrographis paniculata TaxID=175694 RepID=UPI0021E6DC0F|nr:uncharacterized protein LOC127250472 [Andrographis paniculata]
MEIKKAMLDLGADMHDDNSPNPSPILLVWPFMCTAQTKIDVKTGKLTMEFEGVKVHFNIFDAMRYLVEPNTLYCVDVLTENVQEVFDLSGKDDLEVALTNCLDMKSMDEFPISGALEEMILALQYLPHEPLRYVVVNSVLAKSDKGLLPSVVQAPALEMKSLSSNLKYVFLGVGKTLPVIISAAVSPSQEEKLIRILREHKEAIGCTLADIKGISLFLCTDKILDAKPIRQAQRRLNHAMMEVVKKEILKLLDADIIYPISDSQLVSPIHVVPKKAGVTVEADHDGYFQIAIALEDQEKMTFICLFGTFAYRRMLFGLCNVPAAFQW